jgi:peptidoglycan/LPS O-acetylase OafA/YrhL
MAVDGRALLGLSHARMGAMDPTSARWRVALIAIGALLALVGTISALANVVAAVDDKAFTVSLGGLLFGLGNGTVLVGATLLRREERPRSLVVAAVVVGPTFIGYLIGGVLDELLR